MAAMLASLPCRGSQPRSAPLPIPVAAPRPDGIRGLTIAPIEDGRYPGTGYGTAACQEALGHASDIGATWVSITPFGRMEDLEDTTVLHDFEIPANENEARIERTIADARARGLRVALIPHVYVMSGEWRGQIDPGYDEAWERWFTSYEEYLLRYARLAQRNGVELLSVGVEFKSSTNYRPERWRELIGKVREVYSGLLTYSSNWDEVDQVPFWDALDLIGVNAFWPLADEPSDGYDVMRQHAAEIALELESLYYHFARPVVLTEMGVKSAADSALAPWEWPEDCTGLDYDEGYQAEAYDALIGTLSREPWFYGLFVWKYFSDLHDDTQEKPTGFTPYGKRAEGVLSDWFFESWDGIESDLLSTGFDSP